MPEPLCEVFAGRIFQARNIVEIVVVELVINRLEDRFDLRKVANPSGVRIDLSFDINGNTERVTMQTATFVALGNVGRRCADSKMNSLNSSKVYSALKVNYSGCGVYQLCPLQTLSRQSVVVNEIWTLV